MAMSSATGINERSRELRATVTRFALEQLKLFPRPYAFSNYNKMYIRNFERQQFPPLFIGQRWHKNFSSLLGASFPKTVKLTGTFFLLHQLHN